MKERFIRTVRKGGTSLSINIPAEIIKLLNINEGDILSVEIERMKKHGDK